MTYILSAVTKRPKPEKKVVQLPSTLLVSVVLIFPAFEDVVFRSRVSDKKVQKHRRFEWLQAENRQFLYS